MTDYDGSSAPRLRLFTGDCWQANPLGLSPAMSLAAFYRAYVRPHCLVAKRRSADTIGQYDDTVRIWAEITGDPPLGEISQATMSDYLAGLYRRPGRRGPVTVATIRKHCRHLQAVLNRAEPASRSNRAGQGLLDRVPWVEPPADEGREVDDVFTLDEIGLFLAACKHARRPVLRRITPEAWWRSLVLFAYASGLRIRTILALRRAWVHADRVDIPANAIKTRRMTRAWLSTLAVEAIAVASAAGTATLWQWPHCRSYLHSERRAILAQSEIPPERRFGFHALRKATGTELARINPMAARMMLGHTAERITREHYIHASLVTESLAQMPLPPGVAR